MFASALSSRPTPTASVPLPSLFTFASTVTFAWQLHSSNTATRPPSMTADRRGIDRDEERGNENTSRQPIGA